MKFGRRTITSALGVAVVGVGALVGTFALGYSLGGNDGDENGAGPNAAVDGDDADTQGERDAGNGSGMPTGVNIGFAPFGGADDAGLTEDGGADMIAPREGNHCTAPLGNIASASAIDLAAEGFNARFLGGGYALTSVNVRSVGECDDQGQASTGDLVLDTSWRHVESGIDLSVSQRVSDDQVANLRHADGARFWADGYEFSVWANSYTVMADTGGDDVARDGDATDPATGSGGTVASEDAARAQEMGGGRDPRVDGILDDVLSQLAPAIPAGCYFTETRGDWDDLAALGLADPRSAVPSGFAETYIDVRSFNTPDADCPGADLEVDGREGFNLGFSSSERDGWLDISGWKAQDGERLYPASTNDYGMSWSSGDWQFSVNGHRGKDGLGSDELQAIAAALDPAFDSTCLIATEDLASDQIGEHGFNEPAIPDGYELEDANFRVTDQPEGCDVGEEQGLPVYELSWIIASDEHAFEVIVNRDGRDAADIDPGDGYISDWGMHWVGDEGDAYSIWVAPRGRDEIPEREVMVGIAASLDPALDVSTLSEGDDGGAPGEPMPLPKPEG